MASTQQRAEVNVAFVFDRSASMQGGKLELAKQAALAAIDRLGPQDIVSVVAYHDGVQVLLPAAKLGDKVAARRAIALMEADGSAALFAGISKGAAEVRKFADAYRVNRIILLSRWPGEHWPGFASELGNWVLRFFAKISP